MSTVYMLNKDGKPLMPTTRGGHLRHLVMKQRKNFNSHYATNNKYSIS